MLRSWTSPLLLALQQLAVDALVGQLPRHSFNLATSPRDPFIQGDWFLQGNGIPTSNCLVLSTCASDRGTVLWHNYPVLTNDFTVEFTFSVVGNTTQNLGQGFGFWYINRNGSAEGWPNAFGESHRMEANAAWYNHVSSSLGPRLFMYDQKFDGVGALFSPTKGTGSTNPSGSDGQFQENVSLVQNQGQMWVAPYSNNAAGPMSTNFQYRFGYENKMVAKLEFKPNQVQLFVQNMPISTLSDANIRPGGFIGFTSTTGMLTTKDENLFHLFRPDTVRIYDLKVINNDQNQMGEGDMPELKVVPKEETTTAKPKAEDLEQDFPDKPDIEPPAAPTLDDAPDANAIHSHSKHLGERAVGAMLQGLAKAVFQMIIDHEPTRIQQKKLVHGMEKRMDTLEQTLTQLKEEINASSGHNMDEEFDTIKRELMSLTQNVKTVADDRSAGMQSLSQVVENHLKENNMSGIDDLVKNNQEVLKSLDSGSTFGYLLAFIAVLLIVISGGVLYMKFNQWEKKHIL